MNVANTIIEELTVDNIHFRNQTFNKIYELYIEAHNSGRTLQPNELTTHSDVEVCNVATDLLLIDERYSESEIWAKKEVHSTTESEVLGKGVPKAIQLFKTKVVTGMLAELHARLADENISEDEELEITMEMARINRLKNILAKKANRLTI